MQDEKYMEFLENSARQRAALMAMIAGILSESEKSGEEIRKFILNMLGHLIETEVMVGDIIDLMTLEVAKTACEQGMALEEVRNILNKS